MIDKIMKEFDKKFLQENKLFIKEHYVHNAHHIKSFLQKALEEQEKEYHKHLDKLTHNNILQEKRLRLSEEEIIKTINPIVNEMFEVQDKDKTYTLDFITILVTFKRCLVKAIINLQTKDLEDAADIT